MEIEAIVNEKNIKDGILFIPKEVEEINRDLGDRIKELSIKKIAFESGSQLKEVQFKAFANNDILEVIDFSNCTELERIRNYAFLNCENLKNIEFCENPKIRSIGYKSFKNTGFEEFELSNCETLFEIGTQAFEDCKKLKELKFRNCLGLKILWNGMTEGDALQLLDFTGCDNIHSIYMGVTNSLITRFSNQLNGEISTLFKAMCPKNGIFQIMNGNDKQFEINYGDKEFANVDIVSLKRYLYLKKSRLPIPELSNIVYTQKSLDVASKNRKEMKELVSAFEEKGCKKQRVYIFLNKLGYFDTFTKENYEENAKKDVFAFSNSKREPMATKGDVQSYKHELARIIVESKIKRDIKGENNAQIIDKMVETAINKYSRNKSLTELVGEFVKIKILPHSDCIKLINELRYGKINYHLDINFAKFLARNFDDVMEKKVSLLTDDLRVYNDFVESPDGKIRLFQIYDDFSQIMKKHPNKKILFNKSNVDNGLKLEECEINVNDFKLFDSKICAGYFGAKRFDRVNDKKIHTISLCALLETSHRIPNLDYGHLFQVVQNILVDKINDMYEVFKRMCFNVLYKNKDDHGKNFAFIYDEKLKGFRLSPAYDITATPNKMEHEMTINGNPNPTEKDLFEIANEFKLSCIKTVKKLFR